MSGNIIVQKLSEQSDEHLAKDSIGIISLPRINYIVSILRYLYQSIDIFLSFLYVDTYGGYIHGKRLGIGRWSGGLIIKGGIGYLEEVPHLVYNSPPGHIVRHCDNIYR